MSPPPDDSPTSMGLDAPPLAEVSFEFWCQQNSEYWQIASLELEEEISEPFRMDLDIVCENTEAEIDNLLGSNCQLTMTRDALHRDIFGIISEVQEIGIDRNRLIVNITVVPAFDLMKQSVNTRIFQEMSVLDIVAEILQGGLGAYGRTFNNATQSRGTRVRDYCVQYQESDFDFINRLLEEEGIFYCFVGDAQKGHEVMELFDANASLANCENLDGSTIFPYIDSRGEFAQVESIEQFELRRTLTSNQVARRDFDWQPVATLEEEATATEFAAGEPAKQVYVHGVRRYITDDVKERTEDTLEQIRCTRAIAHGQSNATGIRLGMVFELENHPHQELLQKYLVVRSRQHGNAQEVLLSTNNDGFNETRFQQQFECIPFDIPFRPAAKTPKPKVMGPQTALVVGATGEEIDTDAHGRIKVQFHWDRLGSNNQNSSCWVRVAQGWASGGWGIQFIPRIGMEVVVDFLEANPDNPLVVGCVYNGRHEPPFALPGSKTQSGIRTNSSPGGGGFNELRFEDSAGNEQIYVHGQKDWVEEIENDTARRTGNDDFTVVGRDQSQTVGRDQSESVGRDRTESIGRDRSEEVGSNHSESIGSNRTLSVGASNTETVVAAKDVSVGITYDVTVGAAMSVAVGGSRSVNVGGSASESVGQSKSVDVSKSISINSGKNTTIEVGEEATIRSGKKMTWETQDNLIVTGKKKATITITDELALKCGKAEIIMKKNGDIVIKGKAINIKASGNLVAKGKKILQN